MFGFIATVCGKIALMAKGYSPRRSSKWPKLRANWLKSYPACAFCDRPAQTVHHKIPFYYRPEEPAKAGGGAQKISFNYSGYVDMKNKRMAIINGIEYESGDPLEVEGYVLRGIYQNKVVIESVKSRSKFEVLLQE